jgi:DNA mismatch endonuclease, patch repair protein
VTHPIPYKRVEKRLAGRRSLTTTRIHSKRMAGVRRSATSPELEVRTAARGIGLRYRTRNRDLAGSPDLANRSKKWAIFVHGCFWHRHLGCRKATMPKNNRAFWAAKFRRNVERDARAQQLLRTLGYEVVVIWECETRDVTRVEERLLVLNSSSRGMERGAPSAIARRRSN